MTLWILVALSGALLGLLRPHHNPEAAPTLAGLPFCFLLGGLAMSAWFLPPVWGRFVFWGEQAALLAFLFANRPLSPVRVLIAGVLLNLLAILSGGGRMPVHLPTARNLGLQQLADQLAAGSLTKHVAFNGHPLNWMGDWIPVPWLHGWVISPGDVLIAAAILWLASDTVLAARIGQISIKGGNPA